MHFGFGQHESTLDDRKARQSLKLLYIVQFFYASAMAMLKLALLIAYARIWTSPTFRKCLWSVGIIILSLWCCTIFITVFQCHPIHFFWDRGSDGKCMKVPAFFVGPAIPHIVLDLVVLSLPLPSIWRLQLPRLQKAGLTFVFGVGIV